MNYMNLFSFIVKTSLIAIHFFNVGKCNKGNMGYDNLFKIIFVFFTSKELLKKVYNNGQKEKLLVFYQSNL